MKLWLNFKDLFTFQPPSHEPAPPLLTELYRDFAHQGLASEKKAHIENIKFDNSMRIGISLFAMAASIVLWAGRVIPTVGPVVMIFFSYAALQILGGVALTKTDKYRMVNFYICTVDIVALSLAVYWTGHSKSPLYFIYFMPLIIQAFHRDWALLVYYGVGGLILYTVAVLMATHPWSAVNIVELGTRLSFMAFTVGLALLAVNLLRKNERLEKRRSSRLKCLVLASQVLNGVANLKDLSESLQDFVRVMNLELAEPAQAWARIFLIQDGQPLMQVMADPTNPKPELKQSIPHAGCPAVQSNKNYEVKDTEKETGCPVESFSMFGSHVCVPIVGEFTETFGVIFAASPQAHAFQEEDIQFLQFIAKSIGLTVQRLKRVEELQMVFEMDSCAMATFLGSTRTLEDTVGAIIDGVRTILNADQVHVMLWDPTRSQLVTKSVAGIHNKALYGESYAMGDGIPGRVLESKKPYWIYNQNGEFRGMLATPLHSIKGEPLGVVIASVVSGQRTFSVEEIDLVSTFCTRASVAIENAKLHLQERRSRLEAA